MAIEDVIDLNLASDFSGLSEAQTKLYKTRYNDIVKLLGQIQDLKSKDKVDNQKLATKRRALIARITTDPSAFKNESSWAKRARLMENDQIHHLRPLNQFSRVTFGYRPRDIASLHQYLADRDLYLGNHPLNATSLHEVTHKGTRSQKPGQQGAPDQSAHPRGTNEGAPLKYIANQSPIKRAEEILQQNAPFSADVRNVLKEGGLEQHRRSLIQQKLIELAKTRNIDLQKLVDEGIDILDPRNRSMLPKKLQDFTGWLRGQHRENVNFTAGKPYGVEMYGVDPLGASVKTLSKSPVARFASINSLLSNKEVQDAILEGDSGKALTAFAKDAGLGLVGDIAAAGAAAGLTKVAPQAAAVVLPAVSKIASPAAAVATGVGIFNQGRSDSFTTKAVTKAANYVPGLKANPQTDIGKRAGDFIANELEYRAKQTQQVLNSAAGWFAQTRKSMFGF